MISSRNNYLFLFCFLTACVLGLTGIGSALEGHFWWALVKIIGAPLLVGFAHRVFPESTPRQRPASARGLPTHHLSLEGKSRTDVLAMYHQLR